MPARNSSGISSAARFNQFEGIVGFFSALFDTARNWGDTELMVMPGYRDRIVHVHTAPDEGGMNLTMPPHVIEAMTLRGQAAGRALVERFAETPGTASGLSWDNHRWVRYRSALTALAAQLERFGRAWRDAPEGERSYRELVDRGDDVGPSGYRFATDAQRALAVALTELLAEAGERAEDAETPVGQGSPRPEPVARIVPGD